MPDALTSGWFNARHSRCATPSEGIVERGRWVAQAFQTMMMLSVVNRGERPCRTSVIDDATRLVGFTR